mgnify:CR=1 FL=1
MLTSTDPEGCVTEYGYNDYSLELAVFYSVANELMEDKGDALFYGDTGPNITKLMDKNGNSKWTHYAIPN